MHFQRSKSESATQLFDWTKKIQENKKEFDEIDLENEDICTIISAMMLVSEELIAALKENEKDRMKKPIKIFNYFIKESMLEPKSLPILYGKRLSSKKKTLKDSNSMPMEPKRISRNSLSFGDPDYFTIKSQLKRALCERDSSGNTALHIAIKNVIQPGKKTDVVLLMAKMLKDGSDVSLMNNNAETFLSMLKRMPNEWFRLFENDNELLDFFIEQKDDPDTHLETIFKRMRKLSGNNKSFCNKLPLTLSAKIFHQRGLFKKSNEELLAWHGHCHNYDLEEIRQCCFTHGEEIKAFKIFDETQRILKKPLTITYYALKACQVSFIALLLLKILDFVLDLTVSIKLFLPYNGTIIDDLTPKENCSREFQIDCYFHEMHEWMLASSRHVLYL